VEGKLETVLENISDRSTIDKIISTLKEYVIEGNLKSGTELPSEKELALQLGVSRFSVREALRVAEAQGLIDVSRGRRARVAKPSASPAAEVISLSLRRSRDPLVDLADARKVLETHLARTVAKTITPEAIVALEKTVNFIKIHSKDLELCAEQDMEFHNIITRASGNVVFEIMLAPLSELLHESRQKTMSLGMESVVHDHGEIIAAFKAHDPERAGNAMAKHLNEAIRNLKGVVRHRAPIGKTRKSRDSRDA
jgi:GntR family transcriptional repressor for pyruvate dehydrogenase complex